MAFAGDQLHGANQFFGMRAVQKEGIRLNGLVRQAAAAGLFPGEMLVINRDVIPRPRQPLSAHGTSRTATHDRNITHRKASMKRAEPGAATRHWENRFKYANRKTPQLEPGREYSRKAPSGCTPVNMQVRQANTRYENGVPSGSESRQQR